MRRRVLVDTGPLVAVVSERDGYHTVCSHVLAELKPPLLTTWPVVTEAAWLLRNQPVGQRRLFEALDAGFYQALDLDLAAFAWLSEFLRRYRKFGPDIADGSLVYTAEREGIDSVFTLDRKHFSLYRFDRHRSFTLLPEFI